MRKTLWLTLVALPVYASSAPGRMEPNTLARLLGLGRTVGADVDAPSTPLPWRLLGTLRAKDGASLAAVDCSGKSTTLQEGDLVDGVEVLSVEQRILIVRRGGRVERVYSKPTPGPGSGTSPTPPVTPTRGQTVSRQVVDRALADPRGLMQEVLIMPVLEGGRMAGFRANWVKEGSLLAGLGLKKGDVITRVNGVRLDNPERIINVLGSLATAQHFEIEINRDGQTRVESVQLDR